MLNYFPRGLACQLLGFLAVEILWSEGWSADIRSSFSIEKVVYIGGDTLVCRRVELVVTKFQNIR